MEMVLPKSQIKMYIIFNKEIAVYWKYKTSTTSEWVFIFYTFVLFMSPLVAISTVLCRREKQTSLVTEESMAPNQVLSPCCWWAVAACSVLPWSCSDCRRAGGRKRIPCRSCCKADCQNLTEQWGVEKYLKACRNGGIRLQAWNV